MTAVWLRGSRLSGSPEIAWLLIAGVTTAWAITVGFGTAAHWYDEQRVVMLALVVAAGAIACSTTDRTAWHEIQFAKASLIAAVAGLIAASWAVRPDAALLEWATLTLLLVGALVLAQRLDLQRAASGAAVFALVLLSAYCTAVVARYVSATLVGAPIDVEVWQAGFANPRFAGQMLCLLLPILPVAAARFPGHASRGLLSVVGIVSWAAVVASGSRTAWVSLLAAGFGCLCLPRSGASRFWLHLQAQWLVGGALAYAFVVHVLPPWLAAEVRMESGRLVATGSIEARFELWRLAIEYAWNSRFLGIGPMHFAYFERGLGAHPHNFWLQLLAEWGIVAAAAWGWILLRLVWRLTQANKEASNRAGPTDVLRVSAFAALVAWLVATQFDGIMTVPTSQIISMVILALAFAAVSDVNRLEDATRQAAPLLYRRGVAMTSLLALLIVASLPFAPLGSPVTRLAAWRAVHGPEVLWPRFWSQGWIDTANDPQPLGATPRDASANQVRGPSPSRLPSTTHVPGRTSSQP